MPPNNDCCCFCFSSKSGVIIIGVLTFISFFVYLMQTIAYDSIWWMFIVPTVSFFIVSMNFLRLRSTHGTNIDVITRYRLFYSYLINIVITTNVWNLVARLVWPEQYIYEICRFDNTCIEQQRDYNTYPIIIALQIPPFLI